MEGHLAVNQASSDTAGSIPARRTLRLRSHDAHGSCEFNSRRRYANRDDRRTALRHRAQRKTVSLSGHAQGKRLILARSASGRFDSDVLHEPEIRVRSPSPGACTGCSSTGRTPALHMLLWRSQAVLTSLSRRKSRVQIPSEAPRSGMEDVGKLPRL